MAISLNRRCVAQGQSAGPTSNVVLTGWGAHFIIKLMMNETEAPDVMLIIAELCEQYNVVSLYVFGSQAPEISKSLRTGAPLSLMAGHDVDIGVKADADHPLTTQHKVELAQALESLFSASRVDLVCLGEADPFLEANVIRGERLFTADTRAADEYELYILRRAGDLAPYERARVNMILEAQHPSP